MSETISEMYAQPGKQLLKAGVLMLTKSFTQETIMPIVVRIMEFNMLPKAERPKELTLIINSPGGSVHSAFHLIDIMQSSRIPVGTVGMGLIASCGVLTMMAGVKGSRILTPNTSVMSHQYSWGSRGKEHELYAINKEFELSSERMLSHYRKCTGKPTAYVRKHLLGPSDEWMSAKDAVKHGIADKVQNII